MNIFIKFLVAAVAAGTPLLFGTVGEILSEKTGHLNLGVEGMMEMGSCFGFIVGYHTDNMFLALIAAALGGALGALIYTVLTVTFMANQNVAGLTLTIFGIGFANFLGLLEVGKATEGTLKLPENMTESLQGMNIPGLSQIPVIGPLLFQYNLFVYIGLAIAIVCGFYLNRTKMGLNVRAVGENPAAADAAGIPVTKLKYINIILGGAICGLGGAYCSMKINGGVWLKDSVGGLGWIAVALVIFANRQPVYAIFGSFVFGALRVLKYYIPQSVLPFPQSFYDMLPFLITAIVLVASSMRKSGHTNMPAYLGMDYFREER